MTLQVQLWVHTRVYVYCKQLLQLPYRDVCCVFIENIYPPDKIYPVYSVLRRILQHVEIGHFHTIRLTSPGKLIGSSWKFYRRCSISRQGSLHYILEVTRIQIGFGPDSPWRRYALCQCYCCCFEMYWYYCKNTAETLYTDRHCKAVV